MPVAFKNRCLPLALFACVVAALPGCGGAPRGAVSGTVTWEGKPVEKGTISFSTTVDKENIAASSPIENGKYSIPTGTGPAVGSNRVEILGMQKVGEREAGPPFPPGKKVDDIKQVIPQEYNHQSTLKVDIKGGSNTHDFALPK